MNNKTDDSLHTRARRFLQTDTGERILRGAGRAVEIGSRLAPVLVHARDLSLTSAASIAAVGLKGLRDVTMPRLDEWLIERKFQPWPHPELEGVIGDAAPAHWVPEPAPLVRATNEGRLFRCPHADVVIAVFENYGVYVRGEPQDVQQACGRLVWEHFGPALAVRVHNPGASRAKIQFVSNGWKKALPSEVASEQFKEWAQFKRAGYNRSAFILGDPGSGKTALASWVLREWGGYSLTVSARAIGRVTPQGLIDLFHVLRPTTALIDDFDTIRDPLGLLGAIEEIHTICELFLVTGNTLLGLDDRVTSSKQGKRSRRMRDGGAMLRPERFDDLLVLDSLEPSLAESLLEGLPAHIKAQAAFFPIATLQEYAKRREVLGAKGALASMSELANRCGQALQFSKPRKRRVSWRAETPSQAEKKAQSVLRQHEREVKAAERRLERIKEHGRKVAERKAGRLRAKAEKMREQKAKTKKKMTKKKTAKKKAKR